MAKRGTTAYYRWETSCPDCHQISIVFGKSNPGDRVCTTCEKVRARKELEIQEIECVTCHTKMTWKQSFHVGESEEEDCFLYLEWCFKNHTLRHCPSCHLEERIRHYIRTIRETTPLDTMQIQHVLKKVLFDYEDIDGE